MIVLFSHHTGVLDQLGRSYSVMFYRYRQVVSLVCWNIDISICWNIHWLACLQIHMQGDTNRLTNKSMVQYASNDETIVKCRGIMEIYLPSKYWRYNPLYGQLDILLSQTSICFTMKSHHHDGQDENSTSSACFVSFKYLWDRASQYNNFIWTRLCICK